MVQLGRGTYHLRAGVTNPNFGLQEWDERSNYLATYSIGWGLQNGQNLGVEPGVVFDSGAEVFAFGGYDLAWMTPVTGAGVTSEQDSWGTWTGAFFMPLYGYALLVTANEVYPLDDLWLTLELDGGLVGDHPIYGGQVVVNLFPDRLVAGALRFDKQFNAADVGSELEIDLAEMAVTAGVRSDPTGWFHVAVDGGAVWFPGVDPGMQATLLVDFHAPEPDDDYGCSFDE
jgi:hypothetical protein